MAKLKYYSADAPRSLSDILIYEVDPRWSREAGVLAPTDSALPMGAVLCQNEAGQYLPFGQELAPAVEAAEGVEARAAVLADGACAVLISRDIGAAEEAQDCVVIRRGACVAADSLRWPESATDDAKKSALARLAGLGIVPVV